MIASYLCIAATVYYCVCVCVCACVCVCVCVCVFVWVCPLWCSGMCSRFPIQRLRVQFPTIMVAHVFLFFLILLALLSFSWVVTNSQCMSEYMVWCVCAEKEKKWKNGKMENMDSLARKSQFNQKSVQSAVWWIPC